MEAVPRLETCMGHADYFERDYMSGEEFHRRYGGQDVTLTVRDYATRESWSFEDRREVPKPVIVFREFGDKPVFLNRQRFEFLAHHFGIDYDETRRGIDRQIVVRCIKKRGKEGDMLIIEFVRLVGQEADVAIGQAKVDQFLEHLGKHGRSMSDFMEWLKIANREDHDRLVGNDPADWPTWALNPMRHFFQQVNDGDGATQRGGGA